MAFGVKTNERPGTRATVKYARLSPSKARAVLDLIRNKPVEESREILRFSDRGAAVVVGKCLESAVANAENNDEVPGDELFISACYADEGPTLKRWRPRARGRATRIDKKTSHITIIVSRFDPDQIELRRERAGSRGGSGDDAAARRRRVARSRGEDPEAAAAESEPEEEVVADDVVADEVAAADDTAAEATEARTEDDRDEDDSRQEAAATASDEEEDTEEASPADEDE